MAKKRSKKTTAKKAARKTKAKGRGRNAKRAAGSGKKRSAKKVAKKTAAKKASRKAKVAAKATGAKRSATPPKTRAAKHRPANSPAPGKGRKIEAPAPKEINVTTTSETVTDAAASKTITQKVSNALTAAVEKLTNVLGAGEKGEASDEDETGSAPIRH
jgi:hypothetical protein